MATSSADLVALLREALESVNALADEYESLMLATETEEKQRDLARRIKAALAETEVRWLKPNEYDMRQMVDDGKSDRETWVKNCVTHWDWGHEVYGAANSEREAKEAALAASRGLK